MKASTVPIVLTGVSRQSLSSCMHLFLLSAVLVCLPGRAEAQLSEPITSIIEESAGADAFWSVIVTDSSGVMVEQYNESKLIRPASVHKLMTSAAILHLLGPDYRYLTTLYGRGDQQGNVWRGDLLIRGSGDPTINDDFYSDPLFLFEKWARLFESLGITRIDGNIVGNESFFDDVPYPRGWEWDDLSYYYGVETNALSFNKNVVNLEVLTDGEVGSAPEIRWFPFNTPFVSFVNEQVITPPEASYDESYRRVMGTNTIILRSSLPQGYYETEPLSVTRPSLYFIDTFRQYLEQRGIRVTGSLVVDRRSRSWGSGEYRVLDVHESVPLYEVLRENNQNSNNFYSEMLLKTVAAERYSTEGSTELGLEAVSRFLHSAGLDTSAVRMRDASGMSPANLVRASDLNHLLFELKSMDHFDRYRNSLAVAGNSGTLQYRFRNSPVRGNFQGKTGFLSGVRTISGYLKARSDQEVIVTIVTNNHTAETGVIDRLHQRILEVIYSLY
ncbi:MAG: D-alanyl-D-alanine carboxypeptidase/D-alanyl-D-alanine-endopeptidase [Balneolaceae bacterium]